MRVGERMVVGMSFLVFPLWRSGDCILTDFFAATKMAHHSDDKIAAKMGPSIVMARSEEDECGVEGSCFDNSHSAFDLCIAALSLAR
jgi:hypothetical protein